MEIMQKYEDSIINVDLEIEKAVLGAILIVSPALRDCLNIIKKPSVFY